MVELSDEVKIYMHNRVCKVSDLSDNIHNISLLAKLTFLANTFIFPN
jgi:hypothetical protein